MIPTYDTGCKSRVLYKRKIILRSRWEKRPSTSINVLNFYGMKEGGNKISSNVPIELKRGCFLWVHLDVISFFQRRNVKESIWVLI